MSAITNELPASKTEPVVLSMLLYAAYRELYIDGGDFNFVPSVFPSHLEIVQQAARDFLVSAKPFQFLTATGSHKPSYITLFTLLFHEYFHRMQQHSPPVESDPLVDALLLLCDGEDFNAIPRNLELIALAAHVGIHVANGLPSPNALADVLHFINALRFEWGRSKSVHLEGSPASLMPWSEMSRRERQEGSQMEFIPVQEQGCILYEGPGEPADIKTAPLIPIPDMRWLGAVHDGYPRSSTLTSYVAARWSPSFTAFDNAALWQAAMTFGVLEALTGLIIPSSLLLETRPDGQVVFGASTNLNILACCCVFGLMQDCQTALGRLKIKFSFDTIVLASQSLKEAESIPISAGILGGLWRIPSAEVDNIICSISIFLFQLFFAVQRPYSDILQLGDAGESGNYMNSSPPGNSACGIHQERMIKDGWCRFVLHSLNTLDPLLWVRMSSKKPFIRRSPDEHLNCTENGGCIVHNVDEGTYRTRHTRPGCLCPFIIPSIDAVAALLSGGHYPVMSYDGTSLITHDERRLYVAISHVWADGLGSNTEKGLPTCQIERIHTHARKLLPDDCIPAFWIDSLCIPKAIGTRKDAIRKMGETYRRAAHVLVFDESIRTLCSRNRSPDENIFRIATSPWMQRVWTLQEALLARELHFEFSIGVVSAYDLLHALEHDEGWEGGVQYPPFCFPTFKDDVMTGLAVTKLLKGRQETYNFRSIINLLAGRTTSKPSDQPLAIASLLGVDAKKLDVDGKTDLESRIQALLLELKTIPADILWGAFPRMKQPVSFRWAPSSLTSFWYDVKGISGPIRGIPEGVFSGDAICSREGLTTIQPVPILYLPDLVHRRSDGEIHVSNIGSIIVSEPSRGALLYEIFNIPPHATFNAVILLRVMQGGVDAPRGIAVHAPLVNIQNFGEEEAAEFEGSQGSRSPIVCELVQHVLLLSYDARRLRERASKSSMPVALRSRLVMSRVTVM